MFVRISAALAAINARLAEVLDIANREVVDLTTPQSGRSR